MIIEVKEKRTTLLVVYILSSIIINQSIMILIIIMNDDYQNNDSGLSYNRNLNYLKSQTLNCYQIRRAAYFLEIYII